MTWTLVDHGTAGFADGGTGHVFTFSDGAPSVGDLDILTVNSDTIVTDISAGWTLAETFVNDQGSYLYYRIAVGGEGASVTVTTNGNFDTALTWSRWTGEDSFDVVAVAHVDNVLGTSSPAVSSGALAGVGELSIAFAALHSTGNPSAPVWSAGYTALDSVVQTTLNVAAAFTAYRVDAGPSAESPSVSWTSAMADRYMYVITFIPAADVVVVSPYRSTATVVKYGSKLAPAAGATIVASPAMAAGRHRVVVASRLSGTLAAGDTDNLSLVYPGGTVALPASGSLVAVPGMVIEFTATGTIAVTATASAGGTATYAAQMAITPEALF